MPPISVLVKPASSRCNQSCTYCFYCDEAEKRAQRSYGMMGDMTLKNVIRRTLLRAEDVISYAFQGGEPTLAGLDFFRRVVELERQYNKAHIRVENSLQTNGLPLDDAWCRFLAEEHFLVGLSVDGTKEIHDALRRTGSGEPTFDRVCRAADTMDACGVEYNILTVVTPQVAREIRTIYDFYRERGWGYQQYILCLAPLGEAPDASAHVPSPAEYGQFLIDLFDLWYADLRSGRQPYIRQFENYVSLAVGEIPESCDMRGTCGIQYVVEGDGSVYPCDFYVLDEYRLGNLNVDRLDAIDEARARIGFVERSAALTPACGECPYVRLCRGGCQRNRVWDAGEERYRNAYCEAYRMFFDHSYEKLMEIGRRLSRGEAPVSER